jgi:hypothetical protein
MPKNNYKNKPIEGNMASCLFYQNKKYLIFLASTWNHQNIKRFFYLHIPLLVHCMYLSSQKCPSTFMLMSNVIDIILIKGLLKCKHVTIDVT